MRRRFLTLGTFSALIAFAWIVTNRTGLNPVHIVIVGVLVFSLAAPGRSFAKEPVARGRVVAVIPAFNEDPIALSGTISSLLNGVVVPDEIHVIDDGSTPVIPPDPRVHWHRQSNGGKRKAQFTALRSLERRPDFILTLDSDGDVERLTLQRLLRSMSDPSVQGATGLPVTRNTDRFLPRLIDVEITSICLTYRAARSHLGSLTTCSGALSLYRAEVLFDNEKDYVTDHGAGDDRRLTHYALEKGLVVSVPSAVVHTDMPVGLQQLYKQRKRWGTSHWRYIGWEARNLRTEPALWSCYNFVLSVLVPVSIFWILIVNPLLFGAAVPWSVFGYWLVITYCATVRYAVLRRRWGTWFIAPPLLMALQLFIIRPAVLMALIGQRGGWGTRTAQEPSAEEWLFGVKNHSGLIIQSQ